MSKKAEKLLPTPTAGKPSVHKWVAPRLNKNQKEFYVIDWN